MSSGCGGSGLLGLQICRCASKTFIVIRTRAFSVVFNSAWSMEYWENHYGEKVGEGVTFR